MEALPRNLHGGDPVTGMNVPCVGRPEELSAAGRRPIEPVEPLEVIPGLPPRASQQVLQVLAAEPAVQTVWLYGSRAIGRQHPGSDIDLSLVGEALNPEALLRLLVAIDDLLLPWSVDLALHTQLDADVRAHVERVGRRLVLPGR